MDWDEVKKARERLSQEQGTVIKDWGGRLPFALIYPNSYYLGMSNLGMHAVYRLLNGYPEVVGERAFWERGRKSPPLSLESQRPLADFAVLAFSLSYELDYLNVVPLLEASGIPPYAADRDRGHPLVIAGGPCVTTNPMPLAPFFDGLAIGEAEPIIPGLLPVLTEGLGSPRPDLLRELARLPGLYVPQQPQTAVSRQWAADLDDFPVGSAVLTPHTELGNLYLIEVERGCKWGCRFCLVSRCFRPVRFRSLDSLTRQAAEGLKYRRRLGLVGPAVTDHPQIEELVTTLSRMGAGISVSSLRVKPLPGPVLAAVVRSGARSIALAPEAGSERLRRLIAKGITGDDILAAISRVAGQGVRQLKLYFMVGLPTETDEDIEAVIGLAVRGKAVLDKERGGSRLSLNVSPFVPKAGTPFQRQPMAPLAVLEGRLSRLKSALAPKGISVKGESPAWSEVQAVLARGDASLAGVLAKTGEASLATWRRAVGQCQLDTDYYAHQTWDTETRLPWAILDTEPSGE